MPASVLPPDVVTSEDFLHTLLDVALTGFILFRPLYDPAGETLLDLAYEYLNPAAQQLLGLPACPPESFLTRYPAAGPAGIFAFYREAFLAGETRRGEFDFRHDGLDGYFRLVARRQGPRLVVSFTDTNDQPRSAQEEALRQSQAREQAARAEAERQRGELQRVFEQAPVAIAVYRGPAHMIELANPTVCRLWGRTPAQVVGRPLFEALPEVAGMGFEELLQQVLTSGEAHEAYEMPSTLHRNGRLETVYWNFVYLPLYEADGHRSGVMVVATEVTEQVEARRQAQQLNQALEARVLERTQQLEAALREAEHQREQAHVQQGLLSHILGQVPAGIATLSGPEHRFTFFNEAYNALANQRATLGLTATAAFPEAARQGFITLLDQVYASGQPYVGTEQAFDLAQPGGVVRHYYFNFVYQPLFDGRGLVQGILAFFVDVTEQVRSRQQAETLQAALLAVAQRRAQQRQELYQIIEQTPVAIVLLREPDHRFDYFNPAFEELFPPEEWAGGSLQGHAISEVYPRIKLAGLVELLDVVYQTGESQSVLEMPLAELQPGSPRYVTFAYQAYREEGRIVGVAAFMYDVTEQVLARQQLEVQQAELQRIFAQAPVAITVLRGSQLTIGLANEAMCAIWGRAASQTVGRPYFEAVPDTAGQGFEEILAGVLRTSEPFFIKEMPVTLDRAHTGRPAQGYFNFVFQPLHDGQRQPVGLVAIGTEVTDQVLARQQGQALNAELASTNQRLRRINTDLDTFVYTASHDLKSPITNIEGLLLALREQLPAPALADPLVARLLNMMGGAVARFQQTLGHLTDISRLQQEYDQPAETVDLPALVEAVRLDMLPELTAAGATFTVDLAACPSVRFSPKNLRSILYNLLSNAVKYRAPARPLLVQLRGYHTAQQVVLEVQDNGLGLSQSQQGELFRLFRRLHSHVPGSGVGLYMVKKLVENGGGTITVRSEPGVGATFVVALPA